MKKIVLSILIFCFFITLFFFENRAIFMGYYYNILGINNYSQGEYIISGENFSGVIKNHPSYVGNYNLGNNYYRTGEKEENLDKKIDLFTQSLESYSGSLQIEFTKEAQDNYNYVQTQIDKILNNQEEQDLTQQENNEEPGDISGEENAETKSEGSEQNPLEESQTGEEANNQGEQLERSNENQEDNNKTEETNNRENMKEGEGGDDNNNETNSLSEAQINQVEEYLDQLKRDEYNNQRFFNKKETENNQAIDDFLNGFSRGGEKDW